MTAFLERFGKKQALGTILSGTFETNLALPEATGEENSAKQPDVAPVRDC